MSNVTEADIAKLLERAPAEEAAEIRELLALMGGYPDKVVTRAVGLWARGLAP